MLVRDGPVVRYGYQGGQKGQEGCPAVQEVILKAQQPGLALRLVSPSDGPGARLADGVKEGRMI